MDVQAGWLSAVKTWKHSNGKSDPSNPVAFPGRLGYLPAPAVLHGKRHAAAKYLWVCVAICLGQAPAAALSSYLRVLCNCSTALGLKLGWNICMFTFIILFLLYGGLSRSVCRRKIEGENSYFDEMNQSLSKKKNCFHDKKWDTFGCNFSIYRKCCLNIVWDFWRSALNFLLLCLKPWQETTNKFLPPSITQDPPSLN